MSDIKTTEIEQIKETLRDIDHLPWQYVELGRNIEHDAIKNADGKTVFGISSYLQENADFLLLAVNNISSLITTIESQQTQISGYKDVYHNEWLKQSAEKDALIESQKEEIEQKDRFNVELAKQVLGLESQVESLKAITELALKGLKYVITFPYLESTEDIRFIKRTCSDSLSEIERLSNAQT